jgi:hypothetical protein
MASSQGSSQRLITQDRHASKNGILIVDIGFSKRSLETLKKTIAGFANGFREFLKKRIRTGTKLAPASPAEFPAWACSCFTRSPGRPW